METHLTIIAWKIPWTDEPGRVLCMGSQRLGHDLTSKEWRLRGCRRAERSYSTFKVRRGDHEEIPFVHGKEQRLRFAGTAVKRYPTSKVRKTQVRW